MTIIAWVAFILTLGALADAIAHGAYFAAVLLALSTHNVLRRAVWP